MIGSTNSLTKAVAAVAAIALAFSAHAAPGGGIRIGGAEARLHPFFDFETRFDSNVSYTPDNASVGDVILHFRPGLELEAPGDAAAVEFSGALDWAQYLGVDVSSTKDLSDIYGYATLAALFNRKGAVAPRLDNAFARTLSTTSLAASASAVISNKNALTVAVPWKPGGGALAVAANAQWLVETFDEYLTIQGQEGLSDLAYNQYRVGAEMQWRFLPRTSGILEGGYFARDPRVSGRPDDATGFDVLAGMTGLLTPRISATAKVGYGSTSATEVDASTVLTDLGLEWLPLDNFSIRAGYTRSLGLDPTEAIYVSDGVFAGARLKVADRVAFRLGARWDKFTFQSDDGGDSNYLRIDPTIDGLFGRWLSASVGYVYSTRQASWPASRGPSPPDYSKNEVFIKVGVTY